MVINKEKDLTKSDQAVTKLLGKTISTHKLSDSSIDRMYRILCSNYNKTSKQQFLVDLSKKDFIILLIDSEEIIQGFSTQAILSISSGVEEYKILFSGDTIINPKYWGTQELVKEFGRLVGELIYTQNQYKWYWFLISKGHRTYSYLHLFFAEYYPGLPEKNNESLKPILNQIARKLFPEYWHPDSGLIIFPTSMGELTPELVEGSYKRQKNKHTKFFLDRNPEFYNGHELACIAPLTMQNLHPRLHRYIRKGFITQ